MSSRLQVQQLTDINDVNRLLQDTLDKERLLEVDLEQHVLSRQNVERSLASLQSSTSETLELVLADGEQLASSIHGTASLAERVSSKVRALDAAQSRAQEALALVEKSLQRTTCVVGVQAAMQGAEYEAAARHISTYFKLHEEMPDTPQDAVASAQSAAQHQLLLDARLQLEGIIRVKLKEACSNKDHEEVVRFTQMLGPLGLQEEGLAQLTAHLRGGVGDVARNTYKALSDILDEGKEPDFVAALIGLFQLTASTLDANAALVREVYGGAAVVELVLSLQAECDVQGTRLLQRFLQHRQVSRTVREISGGGGGGGTAAAASRADPLKVEQDLRVMVHICQRSEEYNKYMMHRMTSAAAPKPPPTGADTAFRAGQFNVTLRELFGSYVTMEGYVLEANVQKAISLCQAEPDQDRSSMVDDVFFIARQCALRALTTCSAQCVCTLINGAVDLISGIYLDALRTRLVGGASKLLAAAPSSDQVAAGEGEELTYEPHAVALNDAELSREYVIRLRGEIETGAEQMFSGDPADLERVRSVVSDLSKTASDCGAVLQGGVEAVADAMMAGLRPVLEGVAGVSYQLSDADYAGRELEEGWPQLLVAAAQPAVVWLSGQLLPGCYEALVGQLLDRVTGRLEALLAQKAFNGLGGMQLDRDVRTLVSAFAELTQRAVRDKFARLTQMATLLSLDTLEEVLEYWGDAGGPIAWRFSSHEVRATLAQRVDFDRAAIDVLL